VILAAWALASVAGCAREESPLSPTPARDPARHARSVREMEEVARRSQEAEAQFFRRIRAQSPEPEPAPIEPSPISNDSTTIPHATVTTVVQERP